MTIPLKDINHLRKLTGICAIVSGVYQGIFEAKGIPIDPTVKEFIRYSPIVLSGLLSIPGATKGINDSRILKESLSNYNLSDQEKNTISIILKKYGGFTIPLTFITITTGLEYISYIGAKTIASYI